MNDDDRRLRLEQLAARRTNASAGAATAAPQPRRRHPARAARAGALTLSLASTGILSWVFATTGAPAPLAAAPSSLAPATSSTVRSSATVPGSTLINKYGPVQVEATFDSRGRLTAVTALQLPNDRPKSVRINDVAVPMLNQSVLTAQRANVDTVSGATYTSVDYEKSLQAAIDIARAQGITRIV